MATPTDSGPAEEPTDETVDTVTDEVLARLDPDPVLVSEDTIIMSKRAFLGGLGVATVAGGLAKLGIDEASAQTAAGQVGTSDGPLDAELATMTFPNLSGAYEIQKDGSDGAGIINFKTS